MPLTRYMIVAAGFSLALLTGGCGDKGAGESATVQIKDLETADGTINDSMTDLDGVQSEGTTLADTGTGNSASPAAAAQPAQNASAPSSSSDDTEVVAEQ